MKQLILFFYCFCFLKSFSQSKNIVTQQGTTITALINNDSIVIATDSKNKYHYSLTNKDEFTSVCKIGHYKNVYWAFAGKVDAAIHNKSIYNADTILLNVLNKGLSFDDSYKFFDTALQKEYRKICIYYDDLRDKEYLQQPFLQLIMVTYINGVPKWHMRKYFVKGESFKNSILIDKAIEHKDVPFVFFGGTSDEIFEYLHYNPNFLSPKNVENKFEFLINLEIKKYPESVGAPIDIIKVYKNGNYKWVKRSQECD